MSLFENFPYTNLHNLNLDWLIEEVKKCYSPDNPPESMVISVNGESGVVTLYRDAHVTFPDVQSAQWNIYRGSDGKITGIEFNKDNAATRINGNQRFVIYDAGNPPPYPVLSVNGQTGAVTLYPEAYVEFPPEDGNNWGIQRTLNNGTADETMVGLMFDDNGKAYVTHDEEATQLLTAEDIPTSSGVVSLNGNTGIVNIYANNLTLNPNNNTSIETELNKKVDKSVITNIETGTTATRNYAKGSYIIIENILYKALTNISNGDTFTSTNTTQILVMDEIENIENYLNNHIDYSATLENTFGVKSWGHYLIKLMGNSLLINFDGIYSLSDVTDNILAFSAYAPGLKLGYTRFFGTCFEDPDETGMILVDYTQGNILVKIGHVANNKNLYGTIVILLEY